MSPFAFIASQESSEERWAGLPSHQTEGDRAQSQRSPDTSWTKRRRPMRPASGTAEARERFARTFADVLSGRFGGRWAVEGEREDRSPSPRIGCSRSSDPRF